MYYFAPLSKEHLSHERAECTDQYYFVIYTGGEGCITTMCWCYTNGDLGHNIMLPASGVVCKGGLITRGQHNEGPDG